MYLKTEIYTNENGAEMKKDYYGYLDEAGNEVVTSTVDAPNIEPEEVEEGISKPTQLDRIEEAVQASKEMQEFYEAVMAEVEA